MAEIKNPEILQRAQNPEPRIYITEEEDERIFGDPFRTLHRRGAGYRCVAAGARLGGD